MKKLLLCGVAALAVSAAAPAKAEGIDLGLGGYFIGYGLYTDQDTSTAGLDLRSFDFRKETEVHFNGETTLDNGLTVGGHIEMNADRNLDAESSNEEAARIEESYMYLSGGWGRVNFGEEDGAAYLLQVAAPSADDNIDGLRPDINTFDLSEMSAGNFSGLGTGSLDDGDVLSYAADATGYANKITYITPLFSGFQAGVSYTPSVQDALTTASGSAALSDETVGQFGDAIDLAARYQGVAGPVDFTLGAGYSRLTTEEDSVDTGDTGALIDDEIGSDNQTVWNAGARAGYGAFGFGVAYLNDNNGVDSNGDTTVAVAGVDYVTGPFKVGVSYYDRTDEGNAPEAGAAGTGAAATDDVDTTRITAGVGYQYGPGMALNGSVSRVSIEDDATDGDGYQVAVGTRVDF